MSSSIVECLKQKLGWSSTKSRKGIRETRKFCVGSVTDDVVWFEVCTKKSDDFRCQYAIPKKSKHYSAELEKRMDLFSEEERTIYEVTVQSVNERGTKWVLERAEPVGELSDGYIKNVLDVR